MLGLNFRVKLLAASHKLQIVAIGSRRLFSFAIGSHRLNVFFAIGSRWLFFLAIGCRELFSFAIGSHRLNFFCYWQPMVIFFWLLAASCYIYLFYHYFIHMLPISHNWQPVNRDIRWTRDI